MTNFCVDVCYSSWFWKFAFFFGLCGIACSVTGLCTPNFVISNLNGTGNINWGLFYYCVYHHVENDWNCELYPKEAEEVYMLVSRYISLGAVILGLFGTFCHFLSPLQRPSCKTFHSIFYFACAVITGIVGSVVFVNYHKDEVDIWESPGPKPFTTDISWSFYAFIAAAAIFVVAAIFCYLEVRRVRQEILDRRRGDSYTLAERG